MVSLKKGNLREYMKKWLKIGIAILVVLYALYLVSFAKTFIEMLTFFMLAFAFLSVFLFLLFLPEQRARWNSRAYRKKEKEKWKKKTLNPFLKRVIVKQNWMDNVYNEICLLYFKKREDHTIAMLEKVLFIMNEKSIAELKQPLLRYRLYWHLDQVRIAFLSDRLRVKKIEEVTLSGTHFMSARSVPNYWRYMGVYKEMLKEFMEDDEAQLDAKLEALKEKGIQAKVFYKEYHNPWHRYKARLEHYQNSEKFTVIKVIGALLGVMADIIVIVCIICIPIILLRGILMPSTPFAEEEIWFVCFLVVCIAIPRVVYCLKKYNKETPLEIKNNKN